MIEIKYHLIDKNTVQKGVDGIEQEYIWNKQETTNKWHSNCEVLWLFRDGINLSMTIVLVAFWKKINSNCSSGLCTRKYWWDYGYRWSTPQTFHIQRTIWFPRFAAIGKQYVPSRLLGACPGVNIPLLRYCFRSIPELFRFSLELCGEKGSYRIIENGHSLRLSAWDPIMPVFCSGQLTRMDQNI